MNYKIISPFGIPFSGWWWRWSWAGWYRVLPLHTPFNKPEWMNGVEWVGNEMAGESYT